MKPHPSMEHFCRVLMGEWIKIDYEMDLLESGVSKEKLKFKANSTETNRQDRIRLLGYVNKVGLVKVQLSSWSRSCQAN